jgi:predicted metal-binding protein
MSIRQELDKLFRKNGFTDFKFIDPKNIVVSQWVRLKCTFGCPDFGMNATCPPNTPSVEECKKFFREYEHAVIFRFEKQFEDPEMRHKWSRSVTAKLLKLERTVFLEGGFVKTFLLPLNSCNLCEECTSDLKNCKHPKQSRPTPEAMAVDLFTTVKQVDYPINVLKDYTETMNRYAILMVD